MRIIRKSDKIIYPELSYIICGLCFRVHNELGRFRNEKQYADALEALLKKKNDLEYKRETALSSSFSGEKPRRNIPDFIIEDKIVLDLKAKSQITKEDYYQMQRYLVSSNKKLGIIVNFRRINLQPKRILNPKFK
jgi:GxxExxY protein